LETFTTFQISSSTTSETGTWGCSGGVKAVWFSFTPTATELHSFDLCQSNFDTVIQVMELPLFDCETT
jgi:hypothetical protein